MRFQLELLLILQLVEMHNQQQTEENVMLAGAQTFGGNQMRNWLYDAATSKWNTPEIAM